MILFSWLVVGKVVIKWEWFNFLNKGVARFFLFFFFPREGYISINADEKDAESNYSVKSNTVSLDRSSDLG